MCATYGVSECYVNFLKTQQVFFLKFQQYAAKYFYDNLHQKDVCLVYVIGSFTVAATKCLQLSYSTLEAVNCINELLTEYRYAFVKNLYFSDACFVIKNQSLYLVLYLKYVY